jgi:tRNA(Ile2) C34 agmatinyltransferase TiaS
VSGDFDEKTGFVIPPYEGWAPYCPKCNARRRMKPEFYGWNCLACGEMIDRKLQRYKPEGEGTVI